MICIKYYTKSVFLLLAVFELLLAQYPPLSLNIHANIRHRQSKARLLRGRRHGDEAHEAHEDITSESVLELESINDREIVSEKPFFRYSAEAIAKAQLNNSSMSLSEIKNFINVTRNSKGSNRKVTVGSAGLLSNSSWQHVDKSMLYMGEKALNQVDNKKKTANSRKNSYKKVSSGESQEQNINDPLFEDLLVDEDFPEEVELSSERAATESARSGHVDIVTRFLRIVESQNLLGENCTAGTDLNLGDGVVDRYAQERFRVEADVAVNRANMLTRIWKYADPEVVLSEYLLHASVFSMVEFDKDIFAAGNCYDQYQYKDYWLFCPYAYRLPEGTILVKDLAVEYKYLSNTSEWFYIARKNAENVIRNYNQFSKGKIY